MSLYECHFQGTQGFVACEYQVTFRMYRIYAIHLKFVLIVYVYICITELLAVACIQTEFLYSTYPIIIVCLYVHIIHWKTIVL